MRRIPLALLTLILATGSASAQDVKVTAVVDLWYTQMMDNNLRLNTASAKYYQLNAAFQENGFSVRRCELYLNGKISDEFTYNVMFDPNTTTSATAPTALADAFITYKPSSFFSVKVGQFKPLQTYEASMVTVPELLFYDRSQMARQFGDKRDRGLVATANWGEATGFWGKVNVGVFNGSSDKDGGKANDSSAQKDFVTRFEFAYSREHKFGFYTRNGSTDAADKPGVLTVNGFSYAGADAPAWPYTEVLDNKDKITNYGLYYAYDDGTWIAQGEAITGLLGRRFPSLGIAKPDATTAVPNPALPIAGRQHLDQKYLGYVATAGVRVGPHAFLLRYDFLNYNSGNDYYGPYNPYTQQTASKFDKATQTWIANATAGNSLGADYTPKFTEIVAGWNYTFTPAKWALANLKVNYIHRSKNFLQPRADQTGEQGGDSVVVALQVGF